MPEPAVGPIVLDAADLNRALTRISHEIIESARGADDLIILGIPTRGAVLAHRLAERISAAEGLAVPSGSVDVTMYRDDLNMRPARAVGKTVIPSRGVDGKTVVLVDDVVKTGRTIRAAMDALMDFGRPQAVQVVGLVDRGHRELPIKLDYVGKNVPTHVGEAVRLRGNGSDAEDLLEVVVLPPPPDPGAGEGSK